jgi:hypothetical protein
MLLVCWSDGYASGSVMYDTFLEASHSLCALQWLVWGLLNSCHFDHHCSTNSYIAVCSAWHARYKGGCGGGCLQAGFSAPPPSLQTLPTIIHSMHGTLVV